jgi:ATP-dependent helicase HrpB
MLLDGGVEGMIVVVQPRRIAARMLARHVAKLRGVRHGTEVGHVVRFENCMGADTRIVYVTDGVLQRWLQDDPGLPNVGAVVAGFKTHCDVSYSRGGRLEGLSRAM